MDELKFTKEELDEMNKDLDKQQAYLEIQKAFIRVMLKKLDKQFFCLLNSWCKNLRKLMTLANVPIVPIMTQLL